MKQGIFQKELSIDDLVDGNKFICGRIKNRGDRDFYRVLKTERRKIGIYSYTDNPNKCSRFPVTGVTHNIYLESQLLPLLDHMKKWEYEVYHGN